MTLTISESPGQAGDPLAIDDTVRNEPHRSPQEIGTDVPFWGSRGCVRPAPTAGAKPRRLGRSRGRIETNICPLWRDRGTARSTINFCCRDGGIEPPIEAMVATFKSSIAAFKVLDHMPIFPSFEADR
jgi:hypothetical protein